MSTAASACWSSLVMLLCLVLSSWRCLLVVLMVP